jgi:hypothetical protein
VTGALVFDGRRLDAVPRGDVEAVAVEPADGPDRFVFVRVRGRAEAERR